MADDSLNTPVVVRAISLSAASIPAGYSPAYSQYILSQAIDFTNVAGKANEAGQGAYDAQVKNDEQDTQIAANANAITLLGIRVTTAEGKIVVLRDDVDSLVSEVGDIQADYVSKTATVSQVVQPVSGSLLVGTIATPTTDKLQVLGSANVSVSYKVAGLPVVGARQTGWSAATGTALLGAFNASQTYTIGTSYSQSEVSALATGLQQARQRIKALEDAMRAHGLIN